MNILSWLNQDKFLTVNLFASSTLEVMVHPQSFDKPLSALIAKLPDRVMPIMTFASFIAAAIPIAFILLTIAVASLLAGNDALLRLTVFAAGLSPLAELSKLITRRKRPETLYVENMRFKTYSFPSGHSYISALIFGYLAVSAIQMLTYGWLIAIPLIILIGLVGISRIYLGAHFPSDVIAGWILGGIITYAIFKIGY